MTVVAELATGAGSAHDGFRTKGWHDPPVPTYDRVSRADFGAPRKPGRDALLRAGTAPPDLARPQIHVLEGQDRDQFDVPQLLVFASGFADEQAVRDFCVATGVQRCTPVVLEPRR